MAEKAKYSRVEAETYEESLKVYRDLKKVVDIYSYQRKTEGWVEEKSEERQQKDVEVAKRLKESSFEVEMI